MGDRMNTNKLLMIAAAAGLIYVLVSKKGSASSDNMQSGQQFNPTDEYNKKAAEAGITPDQAIRVLNEDPSALKRTSETLQRNVTYTTQDGVTRSGNIAKLGTGAKVAVSVTPAITDKQGKTAFDRLIEKNKAGKSSAQLARKKSVKR